MPSIRIPCWSHGGHDVTPVQAARIIATLSAALADERSYGDPLAGEVHGTWEEEMWCTLDVLELSRDLEGFAEHTEGALAAAGITLED